MTWKAPTVAAVPIPPPPSPALTKAHPFVIPVRYVASGQVVHASSTSISVDDVQVRSVRPPEPGLSIDLRLSFPVGGEVSRTAVVVDTQGEEFRAEFNDSNELARQRMSEVLSRREASRRPFQRFHTQLNVVLRERERSMSKGYVSNISRSGAFLRLDSLPMLGSVVELELTLPEGDAHHVHAYVAHVAERRGVGVQFIDRKSVV